MSSRPSSHEIKQAFLAVGAAIDYLVVAKNHLNRLYSLTEDVSNAEFLVENHHRWASPDSDTHDVLYARMEETRKALTEKYSAGELELIQKQINEAEALLDRVLKPTSV